MSITEDLARVTGSLDAPMIVATTWDGNERSGCLVGFHTMCSIKPPHWLVCISKVNHTHRIAQRAHVIVVHVLRADQRNLALIFGEETGDAANKFAQCAWHDGPEGAPVLDDCDWFAGRILHRFDLGDHTGHLIDIFQAVKVHGEHRQLGYQAVRGIPPGHPA
jgi:flavin reductase (DIM6/NTAB) family NADH-FMN oxidoreductase RutF